MLAQSKAWSVVAFLALVTGLCVNPLMLSVARHLFQSPSYNDSAPLVMVDPDTVRFGLNGFPASVAAYWREHNHSFEKLFEVESWHPGNQVHGERIPYDMMAAVGAKPWRGRLLEPDETRSVVVSYEWARGNENWIGQEIVLRLHKYRVVGIMPPGFRLVAPDAQIWTVLPGVPDRVQLAGKLRPGVSIAAAERELRDGARAQKQEYRFRNLELITLRENRLRNLKFAVDMLKWNLAFVAFVAFGGLAKFVMQRRRSVTLTQQLKFLGFLLLKTTLVLGAFGSVWVVAVDRAVQELFMDGSNVVLPLFSWMFLLASWGATFWCLRDQQNRCRVCFDRLRMPVDSGRWSSLVLDRPRTEYICRFGHGTLYVPGTRLLDIDAVNWTSHADIWQELFEEPVI
jgi:hypothetical protein